MHEEPVGSAKSGTEPDIKISVMAMLVFDLFLHPKFWAHHSDVGTRDKPCLYFFKKGNITRGMELSLDKL
jgi:hypothetical protein